MTSHEYAKKLEQLAAALRERPVFSVPTSENQEQYLYYFTSKDDFLAAARALGAGRKEVSKDYFSFYPKCAKLRVYIERNAVCRKVQEEKWDCESLLSQEEVAAIGDE